MFFLNKMQQTQVHVTYVQIHIFNKVSEILKIIVTQDVALMIQLIDFH